MPAVSNDPCCPSDFLSFWRAGLSDALAERPFEFVPDPACSGPRADAFDLWYTAADGTRLHARYIRPATARPVPVVLQFHDYMRPARGRHYLARYLALGAAVLAPDCRASSLCDAFTPAGGLPEALPLLQAYRDALSLAGVARRMTGVDPARLLACGDGMGGALALCVAALVPGGLPCSVCNPMPADLPRVFREGNYSGFYQGVRDWFRAHDPMRQREDALLHTLGYLDCANFAPLLTAPLLLGVGMRDTVSPPQTQLAVYQRATCPKQQALFPNHGHERINAYENEDLKFLISQLS